MRRAVQLWDRVRVAGEDWQAVAVAGDTVALKSADGARLETFTQAELLTSAEITTANRRSAPATHQLRVIEELSAEDRDRLQSLQAHILDLLGDPPPGARPLAGTTQSRTLQERVEAKAAELSSSGHPVTARSLWRLLARYRQHGVVGLIDGRRTAIATATGRADPAIVALAEAALAQQTPESTGTRTRMITSIRVEAARLEIPVPAKRTLYRLLQTLDWQRHSFGNATTRRSQANRPERAYGRQTPSRPGELVEMDSSPLDLLVLYPDGGAGRADLTIALDVATRSLPAAILRPVATKAVDAAVLLARAMTPLPTQPGWAEGLAFSRSLLPAGTLAGPEQLQRDLAERPIMAIESVTVDRGRVFLSDTFLSACEQLHISVTKAAPRSPTDKPHVERVFRSINTLFTQYLPGYTGPNVVHRGSDPASDALWPLAQVQDLLDQWIVQVWQRRPHDGLRLAAMPRQDLAPNEMFHALTQTAPVVPVIFDADDYIALLPCAWRTIQRYGINLGGLTYDSPALDPYRGRPSGISLPRAAGNRWEIRYDPYRLNRIHVRDHHAGRWIEAPWTLAQQTLAPFSIDVLHAARHAVTQRQGDRPVLADALLSEITRIQSGKQLTRVERSAARRTPLPALPNTAPEPPPGPSAAPVLSLLRRGPGTSDQPGLDEDSAADVSGHQHAGHRRGRRKIRRIVYDLPSPPAGGC